MRPIVRDDWNLFDQQTHAYAEYRVFSRLTAGQPGATAAVVTLAGARGAGPTPRSVVCTIAVTLNGGEVLEATAVDHHACAAIDRATVELAVALRNVSS